MYLKSIEIYNFRGIRHLLVDFDEKSTVLIGENAWGKSSLLTALWLVLGGGKPCHFDKSDLYVPVALTESDEESRHSRYDRTLGSRRPPLKQFAEHPDLSLLHFLEDQDSADIDFAAGDVFSREVNGIWMRLVFCESFPGIAHKSRRLQRLKEAWQSSPDGFDRVFYTISATETDGQFLTTHTLTTATGEPLPSSSEELITLLIQMNPVLRMRDSRMAFEDENGDAENAEGEDPVELSRRLFAMAEDEDAQTAHAVKKIFGILNEIASRYLTPYRDRGLRHLKKRERNHERSVKDMVSRPDTLNTLLSLKEVLKDNTPSREKFLLTFLWSGLVLSSGIRKIDPRSRPIIILEDVEGRFHPSLLLAFWSVVECLPVQKIVTTNSGELLSAVPLSHLRRLCREYYDTRCYSVSESHFNTDDLRKVAFHVRINRPSTLFARVWILVEGETEMWIVPEVASMLGLDLACEGARVMEFAQCGLGPLLKLARSLGIAPFVITDGDDAGQRYTATVRSFTRGREEEHLLTLPAMDIEHYFYQRGFADVFRERAGVPEHYNKKQYPSSKIIATAIKKVTKPGMALAVLGEMQKRGPDSIPRELAEAIARIRRLTARSMDLG